MVRFIKQRPGQAADYLVKTINDALAAGQKPLWFLSGGSAIALETEVRSHLQNVEQLTVMLIDERYGPDNHPDSNWKQLKDAGFDFSGLSAVPVLRGLPIQETTMRFQEELSRHFKDAGLKIALMGIGSDGHTSGILPDSPALSAPGLATHYQGPDHQRITTTPKALLMLDQAVVCLSDEKKRPIVEQLQQDIPVNKMPAQILKQLPEFLIFNDWIGDSL